MTTKTSGSQRKSNTPVLAAVFGVIAIALVAAVVFTGSDEDESTASNGSEYGAVSISGTDLPQVLEYNAVDATEDPAYGMTIPEVVGEDYNGNPVEIKNDGTPKALLFVSHTCPHCREEIPAVQAWLDGGGGVDGVEIITVSTGADQLASTWPPSEWLADAGWTSPVIADSDDGRAFDAFGGMWIPYWVFVDSDGNVTRRNIGRMDLTAVEAAMREATG